jgi:hypothetical protein
VRQLLRLDQPLDRLVQGDARRDEDREHHRQARELLAAEAAQEEGNSERHSRQRIAEVVDQVDEQCDRIREHEDHDLHDRRRGEHCETYRNGSEAPARAHDRTIGSGWSRRRTSGP